MAYEIRTGLRLFRRSPGFALTGALTLGVGIGVVTAMFSVIDRVLINTLPYPGPDRLVVVWNRTLDVGNDQLSLAAGDFVDFRARNVVFEEMAAVRSTMLTVTGAGEPEQLPMARVTAGLFQVLGVPPKAGRPFTHDEDRPGGPAVAVVSARLARRLFTTEAGAIGRMLTIEAQPREVIGVMADSFQFPNAECDIWIPLGFGHAERRRGHNFTGVARLKPGVTPARAQANIEAIAHDLAIRFPDSNRQMGVFVEPLQQTLTGKIRPPLLMLLGAVGLVLLMACANVANLLLARASARRKDVALRLALGARRATIVRMFVLESLPLAVIGGGVGLLVAAACLGVLRTLMPATVPGGAEIGLNGRVLLFTVGLSMATCLLVAVAPAVRASNADVVQHLKDSARTTGDRGGVRLRNLLVIGQVALATILLVSAGLLIESFRRLSNVDAGFRSDGVITMVISLPLTAYAESGRQAAFYRELLQRVEASAGVQSAGLVNRLPLSGHGSSGPATAENADGTMEENRDVGWRATSARYFRTMGIRVLEGREFTDADARGAPGVVIVDELMARAFWPDQDPIGKRLKLGLADWNDPWLTVVGVVQHVRHGRLDAGPTMQLYWPHEQRPEHSMVLVVRTAGVPAALVPTLRRHVQAIDPNQAVSAIASMDQVVSKSLASRRFTVLLLGIFAAFALGLAAIGIYGVMAYVVSLRTRELGVRLALGAQRVDVLASVMREVLTLTVAGLVLGLIGTMLVRGFLVSLLYGVSVADPTVISLVLVVLLAVSAAGGFVPAFRAARTPAIMALRSE
jgi:putative ABC transport system permease protein